MIYLSGNGEYSLAVVGESHYQSALIDIAGPYSSEGNRVRCYAVLTLENNNPHDKNAIRVEIGGDTVGYITRKDAPLLREQLGFRHSGETRFFVDAVVRGGRTGQHYGVWLDLPVVRPLGNRVYPLDVGPDPRFALVGSAIQSSPKPHQPMHWPEEDDLPTQHRTPYQAPIEHLPWWTLPVLLFAVSLFLWLLSTVIDTGP